ncbi:N-acylglucosamine 2-epimerase [Caldalkalibacillus uzonensis]|uniref:N-acylglucosamine 2-epimerase n=2 Tax=Caldalkalibacillus uzonensis TaxID=353224 RepID=A0ABU0CQ88_9BACI|nr:N-acylglucosamine 2-epimerase [Caldalkalibacillus uzonensis]
MQEGIIDGDGSLFLDQAYQTVRFLQHNAFLENGNCAFLLSEEGEKKESIPGKGMDISIYADCFVILGFTEYAGVSRDEQVLDEALRLYDHLSERLRRGDYRTEPYPIPEGYKAHAVAMIMLNVTQELGRVLKTFRHERREELLEASGRYMCIVMEEFYRADGSIAEIIAQDPEKNEDELLTRHMNPGHAIESMWFVMTTAEELEREDYIHKVCIAIKKAFELGWDELHGGLLRFVDKEGGPPKGVTNGNPFETLILDTWDTKLWWPHSEALYATLLAYAYTRDNEFLRLYKQTKRYVFDTFPNENQPGGEWIQIRNRKGHPVEKVVALPVKDPYHIIRNFLLIIELLSKQI